MTVDLLPVFVAFFVSGLVTIVWRGGRALWRGTGLPLGARLRLVLALSRYAFWLDAYGVSGARRKELTRELAVNLVEAASRSSAREAVASVGSLRSLALESVGSPASAAVRWGRGGIWAVVAFMGAVAVQFVAWTAWLDAAQASGAARLNGPLSLFPGSRATFERAADGTVGVMSLDVGLTVPVVVGVVVLALAARVWTDLGLGAPAGRSRSAA